MSLITAIMVIAPLAAFSPFNQNRTVVQGVPDSFNVHLALPGDTVAPKAPKAPITSATEPTTREASTSPVSSAEPVSEAKAASAALSAAAAVVSPFSGSSSDPCDKLSTGSTGTSTSIHDDNDDSESRRVRFLRKAPGHCLEAALDGRITFTRDERDIAQMARNARARFRERTNAFDREIILTSGGAELRRDYLENGKSAPFDDQAAAWFASVLLTTFRESGINANVRVRRLEQEGGINRVLAEIASIMSSGAKRAYYEAFLEDGRLTSDGEMARVITQMKRDLAGSSGDLRAVLQKVGRRPVRAAQARTAFADAIASLESDGDKSSLLLQLAMTADRELLIDIMRIALTIGSDGDKSRLLIASAAKYLGSKDVGLREAYFGVVEDVGSDGDLSRVLISSSAYGHADEEVTLAVIRGTHTMDSSGDKANVLISIASSRLLTTTRTKDAYMDAARKIDSDADRARVLRAAMTG